MKLHFNRLFPLLAPSLILISGKGVYAQVRGKDKFVRILGAAVDGEYFFAINDIGADFSLDSRSSSSSVPNIVENMMEKLEGADEVKIYNNAINGFFVRGIDSETAAKIAEDNNIAYVEQNQVFELDEDFELDFDLDIVPVIPNIVTQSSVPTWGLDRIDTRDLDLDSTFSAVGDGTGITAYIIDSGVRLTHNEFKVAGSEESRASFGINTSGDGIETDCVGHGTHVAGILGGLTYGVAKNVELIAVKAFDCDGETDLGRILSAIDFVKEHAQNNSKKAITNMSLSGGSSTALNEAVRNLHNSGIVTVVSAGNKNDDACVRSPAGEPAVITVGNTDINDRREEDSNFGTCVDLFAPGTGIPSAGNRNDGQIRILTGTSMSAPHVAGVAALLLEKGVAPGNVSQEIVSMATDDKVIDAGPGSANKLLFVGESDITIFREEFEGESGSFSSSVFENRVLNNSKCNENRCLRIRRTNTASTKFIRVTALSEVEISFIYSANTRVNAGEDLILEYQYKRRSNWTVVNAYPPVNENTQETALISVTPEEKRLRFRFRGTASATNKRFFIDNVVTKGFI